MGIANTPVDTFDVCARDGALLEAARFSPTAPPKDWEREHRMLEDRTLFNRRTRSGHSLVSNRPVPRLASHHYHRRDQDPRNFYFY